MSLTCEEIGRSKKGSKFNRKGKGGQKFWCMSSEREISELSSFRNLEAACLSSRASRIDDNSKEGKDAVAKGRKSHEVLLHQTF